MQANNTDSCQLTVHQLLSADNHAKIACNLNAGACLVSLGEFRNGLKYLDTAKALVKGMRLSSPGVIGSGLDRSGTRPKSTNTDHNSLLKLGADVHYGCGVALQSLKEYQEAVLNFKASVDLYLRAGRHSLAAQALTCLSLCYRIVNDVDNEMKSLLTARHIYNESDQIEDEAFVCVELVKTHLRVGKVEECQTLLADTLTLCLMVRDRQGQAKLQFECGLLYSSLRLFSDATACFQRALLLLTRSQQDVVCMKLEAAILQNIGAAYNERGMFVEALDYHKQAVSFYNQLRNVSGTSKCLCNLGFAQAQLKQFSNAVHSFNQVLAKAKAQDHHILLQVSEGLGAVYYQIGNYGDSVNYYKNALEVLDSMQNDTGVARERIMEKLSHAEQKKMNKSARMSLNTSTSILSNHPPMLDEQLIQVEKQQPVRKHALVVKKQRTDIRRVSIVDDTDMTAAYMNTYMDSSIDQGSHSEADVHPNINEQQDKSEDLRHPLSTEAFVGEGSLSLGANARELYTTKTLSERNSKGVRKLKTEIVPVIERSTDEITDTIATPQFHSPPSRLCTIL